MNFSNMNQIVKDVTHVFSGIGSAYPAPTVKPPLYQQPYYPGMPGNYNQQGLVRPPVYNGFQNQQYIGGSEIQMKNRYYFDRLKNFLFKEI
jgi:hypothetical protein